MHLCIPYDVNTNSFINRNLSLPGDRNHMKIVAEGDTFIVNDQLFMCVLRGSKKIWAAYHSDHCGTPPFPETFLFLLNTHGAVFLNGDGHAVLHIV